MTLNLSSPVIIRVLLRCYVIHPFLQVLDWREKLVVVFVVVHGAVVQLSGTASDDVN